MLERFANTIRKDGSTFHRKLAKIISEDFASFYQFVQTLPQDFSLLSNAKLQALYDRFAEEERKVSLATLIVFHPIEEVITNTFQSLLDNHFSEKESQRILAACTKPTRITPADKYDLALCRMICSRHTPAEKIPALAKSFASKGMFDCTYSPYSPTAICDDLKRFTKKTAAIRIKQIQTHYRRHRAVVASIEKKVSNHKELHSLFFLVTTYANWKEWKPANREVSSLVLRNMLTEISRRIGCSVEETANLTESEICDSLRARKLIVPNVQDRIRSSAYLFYKDEVLIVTEEHPEILSEIDKAITIETIPELTGQSTYRGRAVGIARIVLSSHDFSKVKQGDIVITPTTRPDFLPIMRIAGAIVTNEGGLLSHAAIVSRELHKPCVIGTKTATKMFQDGDRIEVDADNGVVKRIEKE